MFLNYGGYFEPEKTKIRIHKLESETLNPNFWSDSNHSSAVIGELNELKNKITSVSELKNKIDDALNLLSESEVDTEILLLLEEDLDSICNNLDGLETLFLLNDEFDSLGAMVEIHSGAGGTEACDWANMLYRMYLRYADKNNYKVEVVDEQRGDEVGIKSVTFLIKGKYAYGYLKGEKGVHRLVRISPFDSGARRHTSFASVLVTPIFENNIASVDIKDSDLKIDVYRSSGAGGQHVNTTDSAVRITHIPSKIVVTCQNERSQIQNKEKAMEVLKIKLYQLELEKRDKQIKQVQGEQMDINFGSQIRSYVMHPYNLVKDHRTGYETSNVDKVLDGVLNDFIYSYLRRG